MGFTRRHKMDSAWRASAETSWPRHHFALPLFTQWGDECVCGGGGGWWAKWGMMEKRWNTKRDIRVSVGKEMMPQFFLPPEVVTLYRAVSAGSRLLDFHFFPLSFVLVLYFFVRWKHKRLTLRFQSTWAVQNGTSYSQICQIELIFELNMWNITESGMRVRKNVISVLIPVPV